MKLTHTGERYECVSEYSERDIAKDAKCRWDAVDRCWWTSSVEVAEKLVAYADESAKKRIAEDRHQQAVALDASRAVSAAIEVPCPSGLTFRPFQLAGIDYMRKKRRVLLGDSMGLGKTVQVLGLMNLLPEVRKVLVICPATIKINWQREAERWLTRKTTIAVATSTEPWPVADMVIVNYDCLGNFLEEGEPERKGWTPPIIGGPAAGPWDLLVIDEAHYCKNYKAKRSKRVLELAKHHADRVLCLTGTPLVNRPIELWNLLQMLDRETWKSWKYYVTRYCDARMGRWGWEVDGASNLDELQVKLRATVLIRRLKQDVLAELPPKVRQVIEIRNGIVEDLTRLDEIADRYRAAAERADSLRENEEQYKAAVERLRDEGAALFTEISRIRHETALAKVPQVVEHIDGLLEETGKLVLFFHHHDVGDALAERMKDYGVVQVDGRTPMEERMAIVDRFQTDAKVRVFVGGITAAGVGITLTAASTVVFAELDWVPGVVTQAEDRLHRIGQAESVLVHHVVLAQSLDARMAKILVAKQAVIDRTLDTGVTPEKALDVAELLAVPRSPRRVDAPPKEAKATAQKRPLETARHVPYQEKVEAVRRGMRRLAGLCDGAHKRDGVGFSKFDADFGRALAEECRGWSRKQYEAAVRLIRKYRRQVPEEYDIVFGAEEKVDARVPSV